MGSLDREECKLTGINCSVPMHVQMRLLNTSYDTES
jgi:hypothetical protein